jgi:hypothetical protein
MRTADVKSENLRYMSMNRLFQLADERKSVWWTSRKRLWSAAFFQNWNARQLKRWLDQGWLLEVIE